MTHDSDQSNPGSRSSRLHMVCGAPGSASHRMEATRGLKCAAECVSSMARRLENFPAATGARYPWDEWLDGSVWQLIRGEDFTAKASTFRTNAQLQAKKRGVVNNIGAAKAKAGGWVSILALGENIILSTAQSV